jgi:hypothetical protein
MKKTHPELYDYCINKLGCGKVLDYIDIPYWQEEIRNNGITEKGWQDSRIWWKENY